MKVASDDLIEYHTVYRDGYEAAINGLESGNVLKLSNDRTEA